MAADFSKPTTNSTKLGFPQEIVDNDQELAKVHEGGGSSSNKPVGTKRIDSDGTAYRWNGASWDLLGYVSLTPALNDGTSIGETQFGDGWIELNIEGTGDRNSYIDFWAHGATNDNDARIIRQLGANGDFVFENKGDGGIKFTCPDGGTGYAFNPTFFNSDFTVWGTDSSKRLFWDASTGELGINNGSPIHTLDVTGTAKFSIGLKDTTIDSTNSIDGAALQAGSVPSSALAAGSTGGVNRYYVHPTGTGNGSGTDANNRMSETNFRNEFANFNTAIVNVADNTTYSNILEPTLGNDTDPGRITAGKTIMLEVELTFQGNTTTFTTLQITDGMRVFLYSGSGTSALVNIGTLDMDGHSYLGGQMSEVHDSDPVDKLSVGAVTNIGMRGSPIIHMPQTDFEYTGNTQDIVFKGDTTFKSYTQTSPTYGTYISEGSIFRIAYLGNSDDFFTTNGKLGICYGSKLIMNGDITCDNLEVSDMSTIDCGTMTVNNASGTNVKRMSMVSCFSSSALNADSSSLVTTGLNFGIGTNRPLMFLDA